MRGDRQRQGPPSRPRPGRRRHLLSRRVGNDEPELLKLIGDVLDLADGREVTWAIDMTGGEPALLLALLVSHGQEVLSTCPVGWSTGPLTATGARARPMPVMPT